MDPGNEPRVLLLGLPALKAHCPALRAAPVWVYFHENQFAHPLHERQASAHRIGWQFSSLQNALCADAIDFNTEFNRQTFLAGLRRMLKRMPERLPGDPAGRLEARSEVLPVPLTKEFAAFRDEAKDPRLIVWNHRWEWDKRPQCFLRALRELVQEGIDFRLAMMGWGGGRDDSFAEDRVSLEPHLVHWGEADDATYRKWISRAGIGVSCALHDFQGLAMLELAQTGATPIVPNRVAYPECLPEALFYEGSEPDEEREVEDLKAALLRRLETPAAPSVCLRDLPTWENLVETYRTRMTALIRHEGGRG